LSCIPLFGSTSIGLVSREGGGGQRRREAAIRGKKEREEGGRREGRAKEEGKGRADPYCSHLGHG
jgi:hypothetical protein